MDNNLKGVWIDGGVWECEELTLIEKLFIQKIKDLDNEKGCFANNSFFSDFFGLTKQRCSQIISSLNSKKLISVKIKYKKGTKQVEKRTLKILNRGVKLFKGGVKEINNPMKNIKGGCKENVKDNNILLNNRINNLNKCVEKKNTHIEKLNSEIESLKQQVESLKTELKKQKEKGSAKREKGNHVFPNLKSEKEYNPNDKRKDKNLPFDLCSARQTIDSLFPNLEKLKESFESFSSYKPSKEIYEKCLKTFVEDGITRYYTGIRTIEKLEAKLYEWIQKEVKFQRNEPKKETTDLIHVHNEETEDEYFRRKNSWLFD